MHGRAAAMSAAGDVVPVSLPIIQHVQERLSRLSEDAGYLSSELQQRAGASEIGGDGDGSDAAARQRREATVARLRSVETIVHALKLNFASLAALQRRPTDAEQRLLRELASGGGGAASVTAVESAAAAALKQELADVRRELACAESDCARHKAALDEALADSERSRSSAEQSEGRAVTAERRAGELQEELLAEKRLRELLEQSHATAVEQLRDLEAAAAAAAAPRHGKDKGGGADGEVQQLKSHLADLQKELSTWKESQQQQHSVQLQAAAFKAIGEKDAEIRQLQHEKQFAVDQMTEMHARYHQLNGQLDQMHAMLEELQRGKLHRDRELEAATAARLNLESEVQQLRQQLLLLAPEPQQPVGSSTPGKPDEAELTERLRATESTVERLEMERVAQAQLVETLKALIVDQQNDNKNACETLRQEIVELRQLNAAACSERDELLRSRQSLLDEVNAAAELMSSEKERMDVQMQEQHTKVTTLQKQLAEFEAIRSGLEARVGLLQQQLAAHSHFEQTIAELLEQKSKLAYENGQLLALKERLHGAEQESRAAQQELQASGAREEEARQECERLRAQCTANDAELKKLRGDGEHSGAELERLGRECQRLGEALAAALLAGQLARTKAPRDADEAQKDAALLSERVEELEDALQAQASVHQHTISTLKQDSATTTVSLESLVELHAQLQAEYDKVQKLLGKRDGQLQNMRLGSKEVQRKMNALEKELESVKKALSEKEAAEASKVKGLQQNLRRCKQDNCALVKSLKECYAASRQADAKVRQLESELADRVESLARLQADRLREREELAAYHRDREERTREEMETIAARERDKVYEKVELDMQQLQQEVESLLERIGDLQVTNDALEARLRRSESAAAESLAQHATVLAQLDASEVKRRHLEQSVEKLKGMTTKLVEMERLKDQYMRKSSEQERQISEFAAQVRSLQTELKEVVASLQNEHDMQLSEARHQIVQERRRAESLSRRFDECEEHLRRLEQQLSPASATVSPGSSRLGDRSGGRPAVTSRSRFCGGSGGGGGSSSGSIASTASDGGRGDTSRAGGMHETGGGAVGDKSGYKIGWSNPASRREASLAAAGGVGGRSPSSLPAYGDGLDDWQHTSSRSPIATGECSGRASASTEESQMIITAAKAKHFVQASQAMLSRLAEAARLSSPRDTASDESDCRSSDSGGGGRDGQLAVPQRPRRRRRKRDFRVEADLPHTPSFSASESSTRQLEALIEEMERRNLISS